MCVNLRIQAPASEADIYYKELIIGDSGELFTSARHKHVELDIVYFETSDEYIMYDYLRGYPRSFHAWRGNGRSTFRWGISWDTSNCILPLIRVPCLLLDIVAADKNEVAGRVMYLFSHEMWERYQSDLSSKPIDITENCVTVNPEEALHEH